MNDLVEKIKKARFIWICGNGGSAATAEHFTTDLVKKGYRAICLNSNVSIMTMIANDYGYYDVFAKQLEIYATPDDLVITISCSGNSRNIYSVEDMAQGLTTYAFETFGRIKDYGLLENEHMRFAHEVVSKLKDIT